MRINAYPPCWSGGEGEEEDREGWRREDGGGKREDGGWRKEEGRRERKKC